MPSTMASTKAVPSFLYMFGKGGPDDGFGGGLMCGLNVVLVWPHCEHVAYLSTSGEPQFEQKPLIFCDDLIGVPQELHEEIPAGTEDPQFEHVELTIRKRFVANIKIIIPLEVMV